MSVTWWMSSITSSGSPPNAWRTRSSGPLVQCDHDAGGGDHRADGLLREARGEGTADLPDEDFGGAYCLDNGRPSFPPSILAMARILQHYDCAYGSQTGVQQAKEVEIELATKMPGAPEGPFSAAQFQVSEDRRSAVCPAGNPSTSLHRSNEDLVHNWSPKVCGPCPLKSQCTKGLGRSLRVPAYFHDRRAREAYAKSSEGKKVLRERVVVEHAIARVKRLGAGASRYFGRTKTRAQWWWSAAVANLSLVWNRPEAAGARG